MTTTYNFPRIVIDHGTSWRGVAHRWSTQYFVSGDTPDSSDANGLMTNLIDMETALLYPNEGSAGFLEARCYGTAGGAPIATLHYADLADPADWYSYTGSDWHSGEEEYWNSVAETCLRVTIPLTGLSSSGKPCFLQKYYHSVPVSKGTGIGDPDIPADDVTSITATVAILNNGGLTGGRRVISPNGRLPSANPTVQQYYGNHQMPRGRKRKKSSGTVSLTPSLLAIIEDGAKDAAKVASLVGGE